MTREANQIVERLVAWAEAEPSVRVVVLTSSRARADETVDELSDFDVIVGVTDVDTFLRDGGYVDAYPRPLARWGDEHEVLGLGTSFRGVVYADGTKIDFTIWPNELLVRVAEHDSLPDSLDVGYRVLLDKDGETDRWKPATYRAHVPSPPTDAEYRALVDEFWWSSTYVAKSLRRGDLLLAKYALDVDMKLGPLRRVLEWRLELDREWSWRPGVLGRGFERTLPADLWEELRSTYVGPDADENWEALFRTAALFRRVATDVGNALGYEYPGYVDEGVAAHLRQVQRS